jgi:cytoskeletal protein RodZ
LGGSTAAFAHKEAGSQGSEDGEPVKAASEKSGRKRVLLLALVGLIALIVVVLAVMLPVYFKVIRPNQNNAESSTSSDSGSTTHHTSATPTQTAAPTQATSGGDGSTVTLEDGTTFTYANTFGGNCA